MKINKRFVPAHIARRVSYSGTNPGINICVHQTGNTRAGADAEMHARLQENGNSRAASWHIQVDDKQAIQSFPYTARCWAAGDGSGAGNMSSIHVEICINSDGDYKKAVENGAATVATVMKDLDIPIHRVKQHFDFNGKNCPAQIRAGQQGITWDDFLAMVQGSAPSKPAKPAASKPAPSKPSGKPNLTTDSIVTYLNSIGKPSDYNSRAKMAKDHGIANYEGSASQNTQLLAILRSGKKPASNVSATGNDKSHIGRRVEAIAPVVNYYDSPRWTNPSGTFRRGHGWTVVDVLTTSGSKQYKVKNSRGAIFYITYRKDLVKLV